MIPNIRALTVCRAILNEWFFRLGIPKQLLSDRGSQFTGEVMQTISHILGFRKLFTTAYHPQTDGDYVLNNTEDTNRTGPITLPDALLGDGNNFSMSEFLRILKTP